VPINGRAQFLATWRKKPPIGPGELSVSMGWAVQEVDFLEPTPRHHETQLAGHLCCNVAVGCRPSGPGEVFPCGPGPIPELRPPFRRTCNFL